MLQFGDLFRIIVWRKQKSFNFPLRESSLKLLKYLLFFLFQHFLIVWSNPPLPLTFLSLVYSSTLFFYVTSGLSLTPSPSVSLPYIIFVNSVAFIPSTCPNRISVLRFTLSVTLIVLSLTCTTSHIHAFTAFPIPLRQEPPLR